MSYKVEGRNQGDEAEAKECQKLSANHQKLKECQGTDSLSQLSEETNLTEILILNF